MNTILFVGEHPRAFDVRRHTHEHWELVYCTSGEGVFRFSNGSSMNYHAGNLVVIPPHEVHSNSSSGGFTNIHLTMADSSFTGKNPFRVADDDVGSLRAAFLQAKYYYMSDLKMSELVLTALGDLIASYIVVFQISAEYSEPVEQLRTSIVRNFSRSDYALDEVIRSLPFNYDYLRKLFKKEVGMSPLEYMTNLRMKSAERLLTAMWSITSYTISEIAQMCGFDDSLYFSRVFKKYYGCSPTNYAKRHEQLRQSQAGDPGRVEVDAQE